MSDGLVWMVKGGDSLPVHPTCVAAHQAAGWSISEAPPAESQPAPRPRRTAKQQPNTGADDGNR